MARSAEVKFYIQLDDDNIPEKIEWEATDAGFEGRKPADCISISLWDKEEKNTLGIDLWTKDMMVHEMYRHFSQTLQKMTNTAERSTGNAELVGMLRNFSREFSEKISEVLERES